MGYGYPSKGICRPLRLLPLHNLKAGVTYPATLDHATDHDNRVAPAHSFKFIAALQWVHRGDAPVLIWIEAQSGQDVGKPTASH